MRGDLHTHTTYCDGKNTPEEMVLAAISRGDRYIGFSGHSYTDFDDRYCMTEEGMKDYVAELKRLRKKYGERILIFIGLEEDSFSQDDTSEFDYVIGSVHYLKYGEEYVEVDDTPEELRRARDKYCGGDIYRLCEDYFKSVGEVAEKTRCQIIGHFDLIAKFIEKEPLFDTEDPRYVRAWKAAADRLLRTGVPFEINTGAISRGYRTTPYPAAEIREYIREKGGKFVLTGDSHSTDALCTAFEKYEREASEPDFVTQLLS